MSEDSIFSARPGSTREPIDVTPPPRDGADRGLGFEDPDAEVPRRLSRGRKVAIGAGLVVGVAALGVLGVFGSRIWSQKDATLTMPDQVAGLVRDDSERAKATADDLRSAFAAGIDLDESAGAVYTDPAAADRSVLLFGGTTLLWSPERDLDTLFELVADDSATIAGLHEVPAGDLGGVMKCGSTPGDGATEIPVCGWADHGSVAIGLFPGRSQDDAGTIMREMRDAIQTRD
jgi:hypothetical protein